MTGSAWLSFQNAFLNGPAGVFLFFWLTHQAAELPH
jgi:hypothetical protein